MGATSVCGLMCVSCVALRRRGAWRAPGPQFSFNNIYPSLPPLAASGLREFNYARPSRGGVMSQVPYAIYAMSARAKRTRTSRLEMLNHSQFKAWPSTLIDPMNSGFRLRSESHLRKELNH